MSGKVDGNPYGEQYETRPMHRHWSTYDMKLEGCRYNLLDEIVRGNPFDAPRFEAIAAELEQLAHSKGWGEEDSFIFSAAGRATAEDRANDDRIAAEVAQHEEDPDWLFSEYTDKSDRLLKEASATREAREAVHVMLSRVLDARTKGREARRGVDAETGKQPGFP
jgi:hypothetical protein